MLQKGDDDANQNYVYVDDSFDSTLNTNTIHLTSFWATTFKN